MDRLRLLLIYLLMEERTEEISWNREHSESFRDGGIDDNSLRAQTGKKAGLGLKATL